MTTSDGFFMGLVVGVFTTFITMMVVLTFFPVAPLFLTIIPISAPIWMPVVGGSIGHLNDNFNIRF